MISLQDLANWMKYSISAHNSQPFQIAKAGNNFQVWVDEKRLLPVADPQHKDLFTSLGALFETWISFAAVQNFKLAIKAQDYELHLNRPILEFEVRQGAGFQDSTISLYENRFSYRGAFNKKLQIFQKKIENPNSFLLIDKERQNKIAQLYDQVNLEAMTSKGYIEELYQWLRFSPGHSQWSKDGLNSESMALIGLENWGASQVLRPAVFRGLHALGMAKLLIQESDKINSALGLFVIWANPYSDHFECGRIFQREWVKLTAHNLFGAPLSVLTDREDKRAEVKGLLGLNENQKLVNVLRVGFLDPSYTRYPVARRSAEENIRSS